MKQGFWQRIRQRYRISVMNEDTLGEVSHFRLSKIGMFLWLSLLFIVTFSLLALLVWLTPLRNYLPGYDADIRKELITEVARVDSLQNALDLQNEYLGIIRNVVSGEVQSDTVVPLDSLALRQKARLLEERSQLTDEFMAQYENKEKDNWALFETTASTPVFTLLRPARGVIEENLSDEKNICLRTPKQENICAVLSGTIIYAVQTLDDDWVMVMQHEGEYLSVYKHIGKPLRQQGESIDAGEAIGIVGDEQILFFSLWQKGRSINPEEVIAF